MRTSRPWIILTVAALVMTACGTRLPNSAFTELQQGKSSSSAQASPGDSGGDTTDTGTDVTAGADTGAGGGGSASTGASGGAPGSSGGTASTGGGSTSSGGGAASSGPNTASDVGVTPTSIKVGNVTAIQGVFGPEAFGVSLRGLQVYLQSINDQGGVNGRKIILDSCDDRENAAQNLQCAQKLVDDDKVFAFLANNSDASARSARFINDRGVPLVGFPLDSGVYKYPHEYSIYPYTGYPKDGKSVGLNGTIYQLTASYHWFKQVKQINKAAVFFYTIAVSQSQGYAIENDLKAEGVNVVYEGGGSHSGENPAAPSFDTDVVNMKAKGVQGIWDAIDVGANEKLCESIDRQSMTADQKGPLIAKVSTIEAWGQAVGTDFHSPCRNSVYSNGFSVPYSDTSNPEIVKFLADIDKYNPGARAKMHQWTVEGYTIGKMFVDGIRSMGANVTRVGFENWIRGLSGYTNSGLWAPRDWKPVDFSKPANDCESIVQWNQSKNTLAPAVPPFYCAVTKFIGYQPSDDGA